MTRSTRCSSPSPSGATTCSAVRLRWRRTFDSSFRSSGSRAWSMQDLRLARSLEERDDAMDRHNADLMSAILRLEGPDAVPLAIQTLLAGRALERIADHSVMIGERLRYMLTGNTESLSKEVGP